MRPRVLEYDVAGVGAPLILVPGGLTGWLSWIPHQERLADEGYEVIRVQPIHNEMGSAGAVGVRGYTAQVEVESLALTLEELEVSTAHFAGWSKGGQALLDFAIAHGQRLRSLTLVEPAAYWVLGLFDDTDAKLDRFIAYLDGLAGRPVDAEALAIFLANAGFVDDPSQARHHPFWGEAYRHRMTLSWLSKELMSSSATVEDLKQIVCPTLVTKGAASEDWARRVVDRLGDTLPRAQVVEIPGRHAHHIESIDVFLDLLEDHLSKAAHAGPSWHNVV